VLNQLGSGRLRLATHVPNRKRERVNSRSTHRRTRFFRENGRYFAARRETRCALKAQINKADSLAYELVVHCARASGGLRQGWLASSVGTRAAECRSRPTRDIGAS